MKIISLGPADYMVIGIFLIVMLGLGFSARLRSKTTFQFVTAGRALTLPMFVATLVTTWYGGILGVGESASYFGLGTWLMLGVPYYAFGLVYAFAFAGRVREGREISIPERLESKFGRKAGVAGGLLIFLLAIPAAHVLMLGLLIRAATGIHYVEGLFTACGVGLIFLYRGGLLADVRVSMLAFAVMFAAFGGIAGYCLVVYPPGELLAPLGKGSPMLTLTGGQGPLMILSFFVLGAWTFVDPAFHQRVASAGSPALARRGLIVSIAFWFLSDALLVTTGLYAVALLAGHAPPNALLSYPALGQEIGGPPGLKGLFMAGMFGTVLTALVSYMLVSGSTFGRELVGRVRPSLSEEGRLAWSRIGLLVGLGIALPLGMYLDSVVALWYSWAGAVVGALLLPVCMAYGTPLRHRSDSLIAISMALAFASSFSWMIYGVTSGNKFLEVTWLEQKVSLGTLIPGVAVSALVLGVGSLIGRRKA